MKIKVALAIGFALFLVQCHPGKQVIAPATQPEIRHVVFLIGDGMGLTQITAGMYANKNSLQLERCRVIGLHKATPSNTLVIDSAAGATAFACGVKTYNGAIGVGPDSLPRKTLLEMAEERGWATGMVATSTIVHATPASFVAHNVYRKNYEEIAEAFPGSGLDYFVGGGLKFFRNRNKDERDLVAEMRAKGYEIGDYFDSDFSSFKPQPDRPFGFFTANEDPLTVENGRDYLAPASVQALDFLKQRSQKGFFLMIEGSQIDWGGHANNGPYIVREMIDFDNTIGKVLDWADRNPGTLVVITADHEAGGCAIQPESSWNELKFGFTTPGHSGTMIPVFAYGAGAELFAGIYENTAIFDKTRKLLRW